MESVIILIRQNQNIMDVDVLKQKVIKEYINLLCSIRKGYRPSYQMILEEISFIDLIENGNLDEDFYLTILQFYNNYGFNNFNS